MVTDRKYQFDEKSNGQEENWSTLKAAGSKAPTSFQYERLFVSMKEALSYLGNTLNYLSPHLGIPAPSLQENIHIRVPI